MLLHCMENVYGCGRVIHNASFQFKFSLPKIVKTIYSLEGLILQLQPFCPGAGSVLLITASSSSLDRVPVPTFDALFLVAGLDGVTDPEALACAVHGPPTGTQEDFITSLQLKISNVSRCSLVLWALSAVFSTRCDKNKFAASVLCISCSLPLAFFQVLPRSSWRSLGLWHCQALDVWKCWALAEGAAGPRGQQHSHHASGQQKWSTPPEGGANRWGQGLGRYWVCVWTDSLLPR